MSKDLRVDSVRVIWEDDDTLSEEGVELSGCYAVASVSYDTGYGYRRTETLSSGGLWGIELSGPHDPYKVEVEQEQLDDLREHLRVFGINTRDFAVRFVLSLQE